MEEQSPSSLNLADFDYPLPAERIAQTPLEPRDQSRLLVLNRTGGATTHRRFFDLPDYLSAGDVLILNDTRVTAQRLFGARPDHAGECVEAFLTHRIADGFVAGVGASRQKDAAGRLCRVRRRADRQSH